MNENRLLVSGIASTEVTPDRVESALTETASASGATTSPAPPSRREGLGKEQS